MLQTRTEDRNGKGFSLIELLVVISIFAIIMTIGFGFLFASLAGSEKAETTKLVRQNGNYALSVIEGMLRTAKNANCLGVGGTAIDLVAQDGNSTVFRLAGGRIASDSAVSPTTFLTSSEVTVEPLSFDCTSSSGRPSVVDISFTVSRQNAVNPRGYEKFQMDFATKVVVRNDVN